MEATRITLNQTEDRGAVASQARQLFAAGILTFPGTAKAKHPDRVKHWAAEHYPPVGWPSAEEHANLFNQRDATRMFVVCGERSGNVAALDFDQEGYFEKWTKLIPDEIYDRLYIEQSQRSDGYHVAFKTTEPIPCCVPARDPRKENGTPGAVRIEVRGEGNGFMATPGAGYQRLCGDLADLPVLTTEQCRALIAAAETFNECEPQLPVERAPRPIRPADADERPGDRFNRENSQGDVVRLFERHGWKSGRGSGGNVDITHPTATTDTSGNVSPEGVTHIFSTNTPFEASSSGDGKPHSPFDVYSMLEHGGDHSAAAKTLNALYHPAPTYTPRDRLPTPIRSDAADRTPPPAEQAAGEREKESTRLLHYCADMEFFHTPTGELYARYETGGHREVWPIERGSQFKRHLAAIAWGREGKPPSAKAIGEAMLVIETWAASAQPAVEVATRVAEHNGKLYLDLANDAWQAVEIDRNGWQIVDDPDVRFRRSGGMLPLPAPIEGGDLSELRDLLNVSDPDTWTVLAGWLLMTLHPQGPYPILAIHGERGSGKSGATEMLAKLVDPQQAQTRTQPKEERDIAIAIRNSRVYALDNLSAIPPWLSDALCRVSTGEGYATRKLYSNDEEAILFGKAPIVFNGIEELATRGDLLDRAIVITLPAIAEGDRRDERAIRAAFKAAHPRLLGALCTAASAAMRNRDAVRLSTKPRMADFATWVTAGEAALGGAAGTFLNAYLSNRANAVGMEIEASAIGQYIIALVDNLDGELRLTATELLGRLNTMASNEEQQRKDWPKASNKLSGSLTRIAPALRAHGVDVDLGQRIGRGDTKKRAIVLRRVPR